MIDVVNLLALILAVGTAIRSANEAEHILLAARSFDDVGVGYAYVMPATVHAYRALLGAPDGLKRFSRILKRGTPAGQLYALCALFFLNPNAFNHELARLRKSRAPVLERGEIGGVTTMRDLLTRDERAPLMPHGLSIEQWRNSKPDWQDIAGGSACYRLRYETPLEESEAPVSQQR